MSFDALGLTPELLRAVSDQGYTEPTPVQREAIPLVLQRRDLLAGAQTGTGKTAAFVLPILQILNGERTPGWRANAPTDPRDRGRPAPPPVRALVLTPTRELCLQVEESVRTYGAHRRIRSVAIYGGVGYEPQNRALRAGPGIVVATPGRLLDHIEQGHIDLSRLEELRGISLEGDALVLGARTTYTEIRRSDACREHLPILVEAAATIGAAQIQNRGTLGGNIANASPAGDTLPVLLALDAEIVVAGPRGERTIAADAFWVAYRRTALAPDELVVRIRFPIAGGREARFRKIGTRRAQAISKVVLAVAWREAAGAGRTWTDVRVALGSVADRPIRARAAEAALDGASATPAAADAAAEALAAEIQPIDDVRSTADYRRVVASRALHRIVRDAGGW